MQNKGQFHENVDLFKNITRVSIVDYNADRVLTYLTTRTSCPLYGHTSDYVGTNIKIKNASH